MKNHISLFDTIALTRDIPEHNLYRGQVGTVVHIFTDKNAYEVEFSDRKGRAFKSLGLRPNQFVVLRYDPVSDNSNIA